MATLLSLRFSHWAPTLLRLGLGAFCVRIGVWGYVDSAGFSQAIQSYASFQGIPLLAYEVIGPYAIFAVGCLLILGLFTQIAALLAALILVPLLLSAGAVTAVENPLQSSLAHRTIFKDLAILIGFLSLSLSGSGALSIDNALRGVYEPIAKQK